MGKLRVWWIPQAGATEEAFYIPVETVEEGRKVMDLLAAYDAFQLQNRIKPDYCNCGGVQRWDEDSQDWEDWYMETEDDTTLMMWMIIVNSVKRQMSWKSLEVSYSNRLIGIKFTK